MTSCQVNFKKIPSKYIRKIVLNEVLHIQHIKVLKTCILNNVLRI